MKTTTNKLQVAVFILTALVLSTLFIYMSSVHGFKSF